MNSNKRLWEMCKNNAQKLGLTNDKYKERFMREFKVIEEKGFSDYFLIFADIMGHCEKSNIETGLGRGSSCGSLLAYLSGITKIDPLKYDLLFERFLDENRQEYPDVDSDFQKSRRGEVVDYIKDKYGEEKVCHIVNFVYFKPRSLIKDACRIYKIPFSKTNKLTKLITHDIKTMEEAKEIKEVREFFDKHPEIEEVCDGLEGCIRQKSKHAAGIVITPNELSDYFGIVKVKGEICSCFDKRVVEELRLLKLDILGLRTLDVIAEAKRLIKDNIELPLTFDDPKPYELLQKGDTIGQFQFETDLLTNMAMEMQIDNFEKLYAATTAVRPGAQDSGSADRYIKRLLGKEKIKYPHKLLEEFLEPTLGEILFQETVMTVANKVGNIELSRAYRMIKDISKSKGVDVINTYRDDFVSGCGESGISVDIANDIFDIIQESGKYLFNKSHAVAYSALTYWTLWLRTYYPKEFLMGVIHYPKAQKEEKERMITQAIKELRNNGYKVRSPDINLSMESISIGRDENIYMGLSDIAGVGESAVKEIRANRPYESFDDFIGKVQKRKVNKRVLTNLVLAGVFDNFGRRDELYYSFIDEPYEKWDDKEMLTRQLMVLDLPSKKPLIDYYENKYEQHIDIIPIEDINFSRVEGEIWVKGIITDFKTRKSNTELESFAGIEKHMAFFNIDDGTKKVPCFLSPEGYTVFKEVVDDGEPVIIKGHTYGKVDKIYVDGVLSLIKENDETLEKYAYDKREEEIDEIFNEGFDVDTIRSVTYRVSKNGNPYAELYTSEDNRKLLCFGKQKDKFKVGEIICWESEKEPFIKIKKRMK